MNSDINRHQRKKITSVLSTDIMEFSFIWIVYFEYYSKLLYKTVNGNTS